MSYQNLPVGRNAPEDVNLIIENPAGSLPVKYELDKEHDLLRVDRFRHGTMAYPYNYGFIPQTLSGDGDPVDCLLVIVGNSNVPLTPGAYLAVRPIGVLMMEDDGGVDEKIIAVPAADTDPYHDDIKDIDDLPQIARDRIFDFFDNYKNLEKNKFTKNLEWGCKQQAHKLIQEGISRAGQLKKKELTQPEPPFK